MAELISSAAEALTKADFLRRHGCPRSSDVEVLAAELDEALTENERLREGLEDHIERIVEAVTEAVATRDCGLAEGDRVAGEACLSTEEEDCGACQLELLGREHAAVREAITSELASANLVIADLSSRSEKAAARHAEETKSLRARLEFVTGERDRLLLQIQQQPPPAPKAATRTATKTKGQPPGQSSLWDKILVATETVAAPVPEAKPKVKRERKPRSGKRWLDSKVAPKKTKRARKARAA
jgi:hypothetical protein